MPLIGHLCEQVAELCSCSRAHSAQHACKRATTASPTCLSHLRPLPAECRCHPRYPGITPAQHIKAQLTPACLCTPHTGKRHALGGMRARIHPRDPNP